MAKPARALRARPAAGAGMRIRAGSANIRARLRATSGQCGWSTRQMVERSRIGDDPLPKPIGSTCRERNAIGQRGLRRRQSAGYVVSHAERAVYVRLLAVLVRIIGPSGISVVAADAELLSRRAGQRGDAGDQHAGQDDIQDQRIGCNNSSAPADPSLVSEPRHSPAPRAQVSQRKTESNAQRPDRAQHLVMLLGYHVEWW